MVKSFTDVLIIQDEDLLKKQEEKIRKQEIEKHKKESLPGLFVNPDKYSNQAL